MEQWMLKVSTSIYHANGESLVNDLQKKFRMTSKDISDNEEKLVHNLQKTEGILEFGNTRLQLIQYLKEEKADKVVLSLILKLGKVLNSCRTNQDIEKTMGIAGDLIMNINKFLKRAKVWAVDRDQPGTNQEEIEFEM